MVGNAVADATGKKAKKPKNDVSDRDVVVLGSGNLGLIYLMEERRRLTLEEIDERHPDLIPALRSHPTWAGCWFAPPRAGAVAIGGNGINFLAEGIVEGEDPLRTSLQTPHSTYCALTGSSMSATSWSAASRNRSSRRAARSRS